MKSLLTEKNITYKEHKVEKSGFDEFKNKFQVETLPLLLDNEQKIGGFADTLNILRSKFDYKKLHEVTKIVVENLNNVIDINFYPTEKTKTSNMKHRPIGLGVQGLADVFARMNYPFHSNEAKIVNKKIFHTIYHAALESSMELAKKSTPYSTFNGSPASNGILQFDMWENFDKRDLDLMGYNWDELKQDIKTYGLVNSLLVAPMPTASTSQILGNNECFEPFTSNIYVRRTIAGEFICVNKHLLNDLIRLNLWNEETKNDIIRNGGSVQNLSYIPIFIKEKYKIVWEIPMKHIIEMSADRGVYICQSQSMNLWMKNPNYKKLTSMHFFSWKKGLKTGLYYLRTEAKAAPQQFTIEPKDLSKSHEDKTKSYEEEDCLMCGS
jgi:ribonucleoside-diphosphate reductase alpha chain